jgi:hypothetical protein
LIDERLVPHMPEVAQRCKLCPRWFDCVTKLAAHCHREHRTASLTAEQRQRGDKLHCPMFVDQIGVLYALVHRCAGGTESTLAGLDFHIRMRHNGFNRRQMEMDAQRSAGVKTPKKRGRPVNDDDENSDFPKKSDSCSKSTTLKCPYCELVRAYT